jgi:competence protein ComEC
MFRFTKSLFLAAGLLAVSSAAYADQITPDTRVKTRVVIRDDPSSSSPAIGRLLVGESLELTRELSGWYEVRLPDGTLGYVSKSWTKSIEDELPASSASSFKVHVIDIGTGLSVFIEGGDFAMLYDGGSQDDLAKGDENRIVSYIKAVSPSLKILNHLVLSHPHKDHVELLPDIFDKFEVQQILLADIAIF